MNQTPKMKLFPISLMHFTSHTTQATHDLWIHYKMLVYITVYRLYMIKQKRSRACFFSEARLSL
jgi:hypothetical protein